MQKKLPTRSSSEGVSIHQGETLVPPYTLEPMLLGTDVHTHRTLRGPAMPLVHCEDSKLISINHEPQNAHRAAETPKCSEECAHDGFEIAINRTKSSKTKFPMP